MKKQIPQIAEISQSNYQNPNLLELHHNHFVNEQLKTLT